MSSVSSMESTLSTTVPTIINNTIVRAVTSIPCYMVNNLTKNTEEQCKFIIDNDCLDEEGTIDYVYLVYCELGCEMRYAAISLIIFLVIILFLNLSAVADEFLCPSLLAVAKSLRMSDSLAGVTLLAFGNGCPDIFASMAAASSNRPELIVGELLGAGIFCTSIVAGLIFIHSDFKLARRPIIRDTSFYLLALYLIWLYCWNQEITFYGSLTFIVIYVIYLIVALTGQGLHSRLIGSYPIAEKQDQIEATQEKLTDESWFTWREGSLRRRRLSSISQPKDNVKSTSKEHSTVIVSSDENIDQVYHAFDDNEVDDTSNPNHNDNNQLTNNHQEVEKPSKQVVPPCPVERNLTDYHDKSVDHSNNIANERSINNSYHQNGAIKSDAFHCDCLKNDKTQVYKHDHKLSSILNQQELSSNQFDKYDPKQFNLSRNLADRSLTFDEWDEFMTRLSPINISNWNDSSLIGKIISIFRAPLLILTILTVPVVDNEQKNSNWCRLLNSLHCFTIPGAIILSIDCDDMNIFGCPLKILILLPCLSLALFVFKTSDAHQPPRYHATYAYVGFAMSVIWIYCLATEIISLLKTFGIIFSMSDTAIGLGVLAWGNSLGDIVANLSLADAGYPRMALGASIGAPLLNLLLGFGLSFTISLKAGATSPIVYTPTITLLCSTLATILVCLMLSTLVPRNKSKKFFGYLLISGYGVYFAIACCIECGLIKF